MGQDTGGETGRETPSRQARLAAVVALVALAALPLLLVVVLLDNLVALLVGLIGLAVAAAGAWWVMTETGPQHRIGIIGVVVGLATLVASVVSTLRPFDRVVVRTLLLLALVGVAGLATRRALRRDTAALEARARRPRPTHPVLLCNPWSGGGKVEQFGLEALAAELGVETIRLERGLDLETLARDAVARGADCLGMAGGDGSQALVASIAVEHDLPFVCVSAGTRNHFALDLGLDRDDPRASVLAFRDAVERRIDYATVGGRFFVNNVSLGVYATIVQEEGYRAQKAETTKALLPELLGRRSEPFDLQFDTPEGGEVDGCFLVQVSNNPYVLGVSPDAGQRRRLDTGRLGVFAVSAHSGGEAARLVTSTAVGRRTRTPGWYEFSTDRFEVRSRSGRVLAGVDGESLELPAPLQFDTHPAGLRLYVPSGNLAAAERRRGRDVDAYTLFRIAAGRPS